MYNLLIYRIRTTYLCHCHVLDVQMSLRVCHNKSSTISFQFLSLSKAGYYHHGSIWCRYASFNIYEFDIYKFQPSELVVADGSKMILD